MTVSSQHRLALPDALQGYSQALMSRLGLGHRPVGGEERRGGGHRLGDRTRVLLACQLVVERQSVRRQCGYIFPMRPMV